MAKMDETRPVCIPWRDNCSFVSTYYSILTAMVGAILALAISDKEIKDSWYAPVALLAFSMASFIWGLEKCGEAVDEDDVDKYLAWLLIYNLGTVAMFFGIATYIGLHYRPTWAIFITIQILAAIVSWKWLHDIWYLLFQGEGEYQAYREGLLGIRQPEKYPDALMYLLGFFRRFQMRKAKGCTLPDSDCYTRLMPSQIHGVGVIAIRDIPKGINIFKGDMSEMVWIDAKMVTVKAVEIRRLYDDFCVLHKGEYGCPNGLNNLTISWYLNEPPTGQEPNVVCGGDYDFFAARDIKAGEELTVDYSTFSNDSEEDTASA
jgi:hypothetical protein